MLLAPTLAHFMAHHYGNNSNSINPFERIDSDEANRNRKAEP